MKRLLIFVSLGLQVLLSISPFIPWVKANIWQSQTSVSSFASMLATYVGLQFLCLGGLVTLFLFDLAEQNTESTDRFRGLLHTYTPLQARRLKAGGFYKEFLGECVKANHYAKICYFSPVPPDHGAPPTHKQYYKQLIRVVKANPTTQFKRILRDTEANRKWAADELIPFVVKTPNFSLALLKDLDASEEMPLALSVQIIDDRIAWLVAVSDHSDADTYRDVAIENKIIVEVLNKYFDRLWALSRTVFRPGNTADEARAAIFKEEQ